MTGVLGDIVQVLRGVDHPMGKGFAFALQFNPFKTITNAQLEQLHSMIGDVPFFLGSLGSGILLAILLAALAVTGIGFAFAETGSVGILLDAVGTERIVTAIIGAPFFIWIVLALFGAVMLGLVI